MKAVLLALALLLAPAAAPARAQTAAAAPLEAPAGAYRLDPRRSRLVARVRIGFWRYAVRFDSLSGSFAYEPANWQATRVAIAVDPASVDTQGDGYGRTVAGAFEPQRYPVIRFASTRVTPAGEGRGELAGALTLHGVTRPVVFSFVAHGADAAGEGEGARMRFTGTGHVRRSDFRMTSGCFFCGDEVELTFAVEFVRAGGSARTQVADRVGRP